MAFVCLVCKDLSRIIDLTECNPCFPALFLASGSAPLDGVVSDAPQQASPPVLYTLTQAVKQEPLEAGAGNPGGCGYSYQTDMSLDQTAHLGYTASLFLSSSMASVATTPSSSSPASVTPHAIAATTITTSALSSAEGLLGQSQADRGILHVADNVGIVGSNGTGGSTVASALAPSDYRDHGGALSLSESLEVASGPGVAASAVRAVCGELELEGKELAKLQTVQMDEEGNDL